MKTGYKVYECMTTKPISITSDSSLEKCAKVMAENHVGALVVKDDHKSIGLLTEQDIVRKILAKNINPLSKKVKDFMETKLITISSNDDIYDALIKMRDSNIRHLPVVDKGKMVGLLTIKDVLKIEPQLFELLVELFEFCTAPSVGVGVVVSVVETIGVGVKLGVGVNVGVGVAVGSALTHSPR